MKKLLLFLAVPDIASAVSAPGVPAPATGKPAAPLGAAPADTAAAKQPDATKPVTKQRKKARKSTVKLGVKTNTVK